MTYIAQKENITKETNDEILYHYCNEASEPIFEAIKINKKEGKILLNIYSVNKRSDEIRRQKIKSIEFIGWYSLQELPKYFKNKKSEKYGISSKSLRKVIKYITSKLKEVEVIKIVKEGKTQFNTKTITILWNDLELILKKLEKDNRYYNKNVKYFINNSLADLSKKIERQPRNLYYGELERFMSQFDSFEKIKEDDISSLSQLLTLLPKEKISITKNFIKTKEQINIVFLEKILEEFGKLKSSKKDNEREWQTFFENNSWVFSHLFPYDAILHKQEAYVGGKTIKNENGKVVDFLFKNGFEDNYALLEIKTHKKELLKQNPYRGSDVFSMSEDLSGGINQCLDQKDNFLKEFGKSDKIIDPKCILVIGLKENLTSEQKKCFELVRNNQKNIDIVTFDELENKIKGLLKVLSH